MIDRAYTTRQCILLSCLNSDKGDDDLVNSVEIGQVIEIIGLVGRHFPGLDDSKYCCKLWHDNGSHIEANI
ncbi:hypothetical protein Glove_212g134 [Diversispora epigaea]|uniref:Uncharacterized protein n=1 Tax=Diversispora epigaea TaxID=1348612 RepID=A0A397II12_9GLOM|nr:hypothetical protein Glove_212g134 [Diversispora epigaea]